MRTRRTCLFYERGNGLPPGSTRRAAWCRGDSPRRRRDDCADRGTAGRRPCAGARAGADRGSRRTFWPRRLPQWPAGGRCRACRGSGRRALCGRARARARADGRGVGGTTRGVRALGGLAQRVGKAALARLSLPVGRRQGIGGSRAPQGGGAGFCKGVTAAMGPGCPRSTAADRRQQGHRRATRSHGRKASASVVRGRRYDRCGCISRPRWT